MIFLRQLSRRNGFALIEALIAAGVVGILSLAIVAIVSNMTGAVSSLTLKSNMAALHRDMQVAVGAPALCKQSLADGLDWSALVGSADGLPVAVRLPWNGLVVAQSTDMADAHEPVYAEYKVKVASLKLGKPVKTATSAASTNWAAELSFTPAPLAGAVDGRGPSNYDKRLVGHIAFEVLASGEIRCYAGPDDVQHNPGWACTSIGGAFIPSSPGSNYGECKLPPSNPTDYMNRTSCIVKSWGSKGEAGTVSTSDPAYAKDPLAPVLQTSQDWSLCPIGYYQAGMRGLGITTGSKTSQRRDFGEIICCEWKKP